MTIAEVSNKYELSADTLRYYERIGLLPPVNRKSNGLRDFTEQDCNWVQFIKCMRGAGISIEALIEYVSLYGKGSETIKARKELLIDQRDKLVARISEMQEVLAKLDNKIDGYEERMLKREEELLGSGGKNNV